MAKTKMNADDLLEQFKDMTLLELSDFVKKFEETRRSGGRGGAGHGRTGGGRRRRRRGRGEDRVRRGPVGRGRQEDPGHQGGPCADEPRPEGGQGSGGFAPAGLEKVNKEAADKAKEQLEGVGEGVEIQ